MLNELKEAEHMQAGSRIDFVAVDLVVRDLLFWFTSPHYRSVHFSVSIAILGPLSISCKLIWFYRRPAAVDFPRLFVFYPFIADIIRLTGYGPPDTLQDSETYITAVDAERRKYGRRCSIIGANLQYHLPGANVAARR